MNDQELVFPKFKARNDLSYGDVSRIFGVSILTARAWSEGDAPDEIIRIALIAGVVAEKAKNEGMTDSDKQYYEKDKADYIGEAEYEINRLRNRIDGINYRFERMRGSIKNRIKFLFRGSKYELDTLKPSAAKAIKDGLDIISDMDWKEGIK